MLAFNSATGEAATNDPRHRAEESIATTPLAARLARWSRRTSGLRLAAMSAIASAAVMSLVSRISSEGSRHAHLAYLLIVVASFILAPLLLVFLASRAIRRGDVSGRLGELLLTEVPAEIVFASWAAATVRRQFIMLAGLLIGSAVWITLERPAFAPIQLALGVSAAIHVLGATALATYALARTYTLDYPNYSPWAAFVSTGVYHFIALVCMLVTGYMLLMLGADLGDPAWMPMISAWLVVSLSIPSVLYVVIVCGTWRRLQEEVEQENIEIS